MKGRKRVPSALRAIEGDRRHIRNDQKRPDLKAPGMPQAETSLLPGEKAIFDDLIAAMPEGLCGRIDGALLERFASLQHIFNQVREQARNEARKADVARKGKCEVRRGARIQ